MASPAKKEAVPIENEKFLDTASIETLLAKAVLYDDVKDFERSIILKKKAFSMAESAEDITKIALKIASSYEQMAREGEALEDGIRNDHLTEAEKWVAISSGSNESNQTKATFGTTDPNGLNEPKVFEPFQTFPEKKEEISYLFFGPEPLESFSEFFKHADNQEDFSSYFNVGDKVMLTYIPSIDWSPSEGETGYEEADVLGKFSNQNGIIYRVTGVSWTDYVPAELLEVDLIDMQHTVNYLKLLAMQNMKNKGVRALANKLKKLFGGRDNYNLVSPGCDVEYQPYMDIDSEEDVLTGVTETVGSSAVENFNETDLSQYDYPWNWAHERWGDEASYNIRRLGDLALKDGHQVEWHGEGDDAWISIDGERDTQFVIEVLGKYTDCLSEDN